ncbi:hypothetical protein CR513_35927, partial [Mucuna pruriens]
MKHHPARTKVNVSACTSVLDDVKEIFVKLLKEGASKVVKQKAINEICKDRDVAIQEISNCIYGNALPFNLVRSLLFVQMLKVVGEYRKCLKPPTYHEVRVSFLKKAIDNIQKSLEKYKVEWEK